MEEKPTKIIYGTNIEHQENHVDIHDFTIEGGTFYLSDLGKKQTQSGGDLTDPLSAKALEPYIRAGLVTTDLMPAKHLSSGEVALLAHDIAERLKMKNFWPYFKEKWGSSCNSSVYCRFAKSENATAFLKKLNSI